ncbi:unnamed protein product [Prorocentrum cordatum]|uniref:Calcium-activated potassium channel BK alpha subunit domain-containing protein n=1 Tax=Prorocentrum cordatum TaxID=2364126 RepID=A0ABN9TG53_9DINO|nr:unnamed protein product [Polarella glacialis]
MSSWTCTNDCVDVSWEHVQAQVLVAAVPWVLLSITGCALSCYLPYMPIGANARQRFTCYESGLSSSSVGAAISVLFVHLLQCVAFATRSASRSVDQMYFGMEVLGTLFVCLDILAAWIFVVSNGITAVMRASLGQLLLDCLVVTSVVGVALDVPNRGRTWFSFSFLAALRLVRILNHLLEDNLGNVRSSSAWRKQVLFHLLQLALFVYAVAAMVMVFELIGTPNMPVESWDVGPSIFFAFSTLLTIGDVALKPKTLLGRLVATGMTVWTGIFFVTAVYPLLKDLLLGTQWRRRSYRKSWSRRRASHVIVSGNPTATMLMDFIEEMYHENHFDSDESFDQLANDCVIMLPNERTLSRVALLLRLRSSMRFRDRVLLLHGELFSARDAKRAELHRAQRVFVLPDLGTLDVATDDRQNIMRTFAVCRATPGIPIYCVLHRAEFDTETLAASGSASTFLSVEDTKLSLMGMASLTRGSLSLVCNLCRSVGFSGDLSKLVPWQRDYERSIGIELYQVMLSVSYHGCTFAQAAEDINERSEDGDVYLIGLIERKVAVVDGRTVKVPKATMHPGALHVLELTTGAVSGVFIAPQLSAILQADPTTDPTLKSSKLPSQLMSLDKGRKSRDVKSQRLGSAAVGRLAKEDQSEDLVPFSPKASRLRAIAAATAGGDLVAEGLTLGPVALAHLTEGATIRTGAASEGQAAESAIQEALTNRQDQLQRRAHQKEASGVPKSKLVLDREAALERKLKGKVQQFAVDSYEAAVRDIRNRMLASGAGPDVVAGVTIPDEVVDKYWSAEQAAEREDGAGGAPGSPTSPSGRPRASLDMPASGDGIRSSSDPLEEARRLDEAHRKVKAALVASPAPPKGVLEGGGHLLVCVVGDTTDSSELAGSVIGRNTRPSLGPRLYRFLAPLHATAGVQPHRALVILSEELPGDWYRLQELAGVYHIRGSALSLDDLHRAAFQTASAIAVVRAHDMMGGTTGKVSDARVILACSLIEGNLPTGSQCVVVTDHAFKGSMDFLPATKVPIERPPHETVNPYFGGDVLDSIKGALSATKGIPPDDSVALRPPRCPEDFEELVSSDFTYHPRYMRGQAFTSSFVTSLMASTLYNPSILVMVDALMRAPMMVLHVPFGFTQRTYGEFCFWLLSDRNILALGLYRSATAAEADATGKPVDETKPTHHFVYTAPQAFATRLVKTDQVIALAPSTS